MTRQTISWQRTVAPVLACVLLWGCAAGPEPASRPPNFIVIFVDDMGYGDIGPFGSTVNRTPNLDRIADEGMKLTSFLCRSALHAVESGTTDGVLSEESWSRGGILVCRSDAWR